MRNKFLIVGFALAFLVTLGLPSDAQTRIRDVVDVEGVRDNDLLGYGVVVGLDGTGDSVRNSPFTEDTLTFMLERLGVNVQGEAIRPNNVAGVLVTARLPPFARQGSTIDVTVASIGDASSLEGGTLILTPLKGANNEIYAVAQGSVIVSGLDAEGQGARVTRGIPTSGAVPNGARIEREIDFDFNARGVVNLALRTPDFTTAAQIEDTINAYIGPGVARTRDPGTVELDLTSGQATASRLIAEIENLPINVSMPARIVIDERSGTIVLGQDVTISTVAIAQGNISVRVTERPVAVQPNPFAAGRTIALPRTDIEITETGDDRVTLLRENVQLSDLIAGLNKLGVSPQEIADIIRSMKTAGAIHADIIVQ